MPESSDPTECSKVLLKRLRCETDLGDRYPFIHLGGEQAVYKKERHSRVPKRSRKEIQIRSFDDCFMTSDWLMQSVFGMNHFLAFHQQITSPESSVITWLKSHG
jgi:hypothetical protein